jgi:hypothetical protein
MADPTSLLGKAQASDEIACYGIAFVAEKPNDSLDLLLQAPALSRPQRASPGLDAAFLTTCLWLLRGATERGAKDLLDDDGDGLRRLCGSRGTGSTAILLFACSAELRDLLSAVNERRARELAARWPDRIDPTVSPGVRETSRARRGTSVVRPGRSSTRSDGRTRHRLALLLELAELASLARTDGHTLMLRVEYHRRRPR